MATVLIAWEIGGGLGHLVQLAPLARGLAARGHRVFAALRYLDRAETVFGPGVATLLAAPWATTPTHRQVRPPLTYAQILHNMGWHDAAHLGGLCAAWRGLYSLVRPDVVVFDHAPTALLAARGLPFRRAVIGSGFCVPPDVPGQPLLNLRPWVRGDNAEPTVLEAFERGMLERANAVAADFGGRPLERVAQLYRDADETFLVTVAELDHYGSRTGARYWGPIYGIGRAAPADDEACPVPRKVYAYLKDFPALPDLLAGLEDGGRETVVVCDGVPDAVGSRFALARHLRFVDGPLDLPRVARQFDLAILNAGHGATAAMLMAGVPALLIPLHLEQGLLARAADRNTGACVVGSDKDGAQLVARLAEMLQPDNLARYRQAARRFAAKYASFDPAAQPRRMVERVEGLMAGARPGATRAKVFAG